MTSSSSVALTSPHPISRTRRRKGSESSAKEDSTSHSPSESSAESPSSGQCSATASGTFSSKGHLAKQSPWNKTNSLWLKVIALLAFATRFYNINSPSETVFDEVHFGKFASYYIRREYFFDVHPPLGKLVFAGVAKVFGYDGWFNFDKIGATFATSNVPYVALRAVSAVCGALTAVMVYAMLVEMRFSIQSCVLGAAMIVFDNALVTQSRFILLDAQLICYIIATCYCWVKFRGYTATPFCGNWWRWLAGTGVGIGMSLGVKFVGLFIMGAIGICTLCDVWDASSVKRTRSDFTAASHWMARLFCLLAIPAVCFIVPYWIHLKIVNKTGPGDDYMTPQFQSALEGNKITNSALPVYFGSKVVLKSKVEAMFLHSQAVNYPLRHTDGKVSSQGQQVTGFPSEDSSNEWVILPEDVALNWKQNRIQVKNGDLIRLKHHQTGKWLLTHDVASPLTMTNQEVCAVEWNGFDTASKYASGTLWRIDVKRGTNDLSTKICSFRIVHRDTGCGLFNFQQNLPAWGFDQREINAVRNEDQPSHWSFEDSTPHNGWSPAETKRNLANFANIRPSFWARFFEMVFLALQYNSKLLDKNPYMTPPMKWPFLTRGISFWSSKDKLSKIYLLGNPFTWYIALFSFPVYIGLLVLDLGAGLRGRRFLSKEQQSFMYPKGLFFLLCYLCHYIPFFMMGRSLYFHHYLPCYVFSSMLFASTWEIASVYFPLLRSWNVVGALCLGMAGMFCKFSPLAYGTPKPDEFFHALKWQKGWHFIQ